MQFYGTKMNDQLKTWPDQKNEESEREAGNSELKNERKRNMKEGRK